MDMFDVLLPNLSDPIRFEFICSFNFIDFLQMLKSEILVRKKLEEIEFKLDELTSLRRYIAWENNGENANLISVLEAKKSEKEEKLKNLYWYQCKLPKLSFVIGFSYEDMFYYM